MGARQFRAAVVDDRPGNFHFQEMPLRKGMWLVEEPREGKELEGGGGLREKQQL